MDTKRSTKVTKSTGIPVSVTSSKSSKDTRKKTGAPPSYLKGLKTLKVTKALTKNLDGVTKAQILKRGGTYLGTFSEREELCAVRDPGREVLPGITRSEFLDHIVVHVPVLVQRLELEVRLMDMAFKLPLFFLTFVCFFFALIMISPTNAIAQVSERLIDHFQLDDASLNAVTDDAKLYKFVEDFQHKNEALQATSWQYWCEQRYFDLTVDAELGIPKRSCDSARFSALGHIYSTSSKWENVGAVPSPNPVGTCEDNSTMLQDAFPAWSSCSSDTATICSQDAGLQFCKRTCGYCPSFAYERWIPFSATQVTILPTVVYQRRYKTTDCSGFAVTYEAQGTNQYLTMLPAMDGVRTEDLLTCIDRKSEYSEEYAHWVSCPATGSSSGACQNGKVPFTKKQTYLGRSIYPRMLLEPHLDVLKMSAIEWVDRQTAKVEVATLVYTPPPADLFTSVAIAFEIDSGGNMKGRRAIQSYKDISGMWAVVFALVLSIATVLSAMAMYNTLKILARNDEHMKQTSRWAAIYEVACRAIMCIYFVALILMNAFGSKMEDSFRSLINSLAAVQTNSAQSIELAFESVVVRFFQGMTDVEKKTAQLQVYRVISYIVCYMQFLLLMLYFAAHPRVGIITSTISKAWDHLFHFSIVLSQSFACLGLIAYYTFADRIELFSSVTNAFVTQSRLLFGQWIQETEDATMSSEELDAVGFAVFWTYIMAFMLLMFFMLLNLFLAIIVNAFFEVKKDEEANETENNFFVDMLDVFSTRAVHRYFHFRPHVHILKMLKDKLSRSDTKTILNDYEGTVEQAEGDKANDENKKATVCPGRDFMTEFPGAMEDEEQLIDFLLYYFHKVPAILDTDVADEEGESLDCGACHTSAREIRKLRNQVIKAKLLADATAKEFAERVEAERKATEKVWVRIATERQALARSLAASAQNGQLQGLQHQSSHKMDVRDQPSNSTSVPSDHFELVAVPSFTGNDDEVRPRDTIHRRPPRIRRSLSDPPNFVRGSPHASSPRSPQASPHASSPRFPPGSPGHKDSPRSYSHGDSFSPQSSRQRSPRQRRDPVQSEDAQDSSSSHKPTRSSPRRRRRGSRFHSENVQERPRPRRHPRPKRIYSDDVPERRRNNGRTASPSRDAAMEL